MKIKPGHNAKIETASGTIIQAGGRFSLTKPFNRDEIDSDYYFPDTFYDCPNTNLIELGNVNILNQYLITSGFSINPLSFCLDMERRKFGHVRSFRKAVEARYKSAHNISGDYIWVADTMSPAYFHWMCDVGQKLTALVMNGIINRPILLPAALEKLPFVKSLLSCFPELSFQFLSENANSVSVENLAIVTPCASTGNFNEIVIVEYRLRLKHLTTGNETAPFPRIFVSRKRASRRRILNEEEVVAMLAKHEFSVVSFEELSPHAQAKLCSQAEWIVGLHGAGLTNMLFMPSGGSIIEIRQRGNASDNCYFSLASACNLRYGGLIADPVNENQDPHLGDVRVNLDTLRDFLKKYLV